MMPRFSISRLCPQICASLVLAASLAGSRTVFSDQVEIAWDAVATPDLAGYKLYYGLIDQSDATGIVVGKVTTYRVSGLAHGTYRFCVTAYYSSGEESSCSDEVSVTLAPPMYGFRSYESGSSPGAQLASSRDQHERSENSK